MYFKLDLHYLERSIVMITPAIYVDVEIPLVLTLNIAWLVFEFTIGFVSEEYDDFDEDMYV